MSATTLHYSDDYAKGRAVVVDRLVASRFLIQANSGGGKSRALRQLLEETHGRVQHLVIDPEGEFSTLRAVLPYVLAGKEGDVPLHPKSARLLTRKLMELGASAILDLYDLPMHERRETVQLVLTELMALPRALWRPLLVIIDEAHVFCPERGSGESKSTESVITLCTQGRKRGFCAVLATQRISKLHKDAAAELLNKLVGRTGLDVDVKRAGDDLGFDKEQRQALKTLAPGEFFAYGPAISDTVTRVRTGDVKTAHPEAGRVASVPAPAPPALQSVLAQLGDLPREAEEELKSIASLEATVRQLRAELRRAQLSAPKPDESVITSAVEKATREMALRHDHRVREIVAPLGALAADLASASDAISRMLSAAAEAVPHLVVDSTAPALPTIRTRGHVDTERLVSAETPIVDSMRAGAATKVPRASSGPSGAANRGSVPAQRILGALAQLEILGISPVVRVQLALFAGYTENGHFNNIVGRLNVEGMLTYPVPGFVELTDAGRDAAPQGASFGSIEDLHRFWLQKLSTPEARVLGVLLDRYPQQLRRAELATLAGYTENGHFNNVVGRLNTVGVVHYPAKGVVAAAPVLFPASLTPTARGAR